jgi:hypothetical protein
MRRSKSDKIRALAAKGLSQSEIAKKTGFSPQLIHSVVKRGKTKKVVKAVRVDKTAEIGKLMIKFREDMSKLL